MENETGSWAACPDCQGRGKRSRRIRKKVRLRYLRELEEFEKTNSEEAAPVRPRGHLDDCVNCGGSGLVHAAVHPIADNENYPHIAIAGGGIGGVALAVACLHRGIPFTLYERDSDFDVRSQGYGLTLQQASKAIEGFGIFSLAEGIVSTRHLVHTTAGKVIGEWGMRKWVPSDEHLSFDSSSLKPSSLKSPSPKRTNVHIARQSLRLALLNQLGGHNGVKWGHQLVDFKEHAAGKGVELTFHVKKYLDKNQVSEKQTDREMKTAKADLLVGADGIRSVVRKRLMGDEVAPLRYLGCIVILGICPLKDLDGLEHDLLDSATVFQTANGHERMYMMPYDSDSVMWQLSFPMLEEDAKALSNKGAQALKDEACRRTQWHAPIPQILAATLTGQVSGYPVYDRALLEPDLLATSAQVTLIGDAAHPMSPFKGQGANQALLDALALAREISKGCRPLSLQECDHGKKGWKDAGVRASVLTDFEAEMLERSASKVKGSAEAAAFLHSDVVLYEGDEPRGRCLKTSSKGNT